MQDDPFSSFLADIQHRMPECTELLKLIADAHALTSMPKLDIDFHYVLPFPPGHYYSPLPSRQEVAEISARVFSAQSSSLPGVELNERGQLKLYASMLPFYKNMPFSDAKQEGFRYYFCNDFFCHADACFLYALMRHLRPKKIVEVGSGFSSSVMLDVNQHFFNNSIQLTFIEPDPIRLLEQLNAADKEQVNIRQERVQNVPLDIFTELEENDILFIDSSHVGKIGSDVLHELFTILPHLNKGVFIHFHDVFFPFEYPENWVQEGRAWNEAYFLHSFLQYNNSFEIMLFNNYLGKQHAPMLHKHTPLCMKNIGGSLWLRKTQ